MKRKRRSIVLEEKRQRQRKKRKNCNGDGNTQLLSNVHHPVLQCYFSRVITLRQYLLENISKGAKRRYQRIEGLGRTNAPAESLQDYELSFLLESVLVAHNDRDKSSCVSSKGVSEFKTFTQQIQRSSDETSGSPNASQSRQLSDVRVLRFLTFRKDEFNNVTNG